MDPEARRAQVTTQLRRFAETRGLRDADLHDPDVVESFITHGLGSACPSTRATYRSVLVSTPGKRPRLGTPFPAAPAPRPYSAIERAELFGIARSQHGVAAAALSLLALGIGAGVRAHELVALTSDDVTRPGDEVHLGGRTVPVAPPWRGAIADVARRSGGGFLFRPGGARRDYKNFVTEVSDRIVSDREAPRLTLARCRASFICDLFAAASPVEEICASSGIGDPGSLLRYARQVPGGPRSKAALREAARERR